MEDLLDKIVDLLQDSRKLIVLVIVIIVVLAVMVRSCANRMSSSTTVVVKKERERVVVRQDRVGTEEVKSQRPPLSDEDFPLREKMTIDFISAYETRVKQQELEEKAVKFREGLAEKGFN